VVKPEDITAIRAEFEKGERSSAHPPGPALRCRPTRPGCTTGSGWPLRARRPSP
jgi:hypothetical protein